MPLDRDDEPDKDPSARRKASEDKNTMTRGRVTRRGGKSNGLRYAAGAMKTAITGFHKDTKADWVAELQCGHSQHMRHRPPWQDRAWVLDDVERARRVGAEIDCPLCDMPVLPANVSVYKQTDEFTEQTIPAGLLKDHTTKAGVWGRIVVSAGQLEYSFGEPRRSFVLEREHPGIVKPGVPHQVRPLGAVSFHVEFLRAHDE